MAETHTAKHDTHHAALAHHFENLEQQREAGTLAMWIFLVTEIMFFGGLFLAYTLYRSTYPAAFAVASNHLDLTLGAVNTVILICSSFTMAMAVYCTQVGKRRGMIISLVLTIILGLGFLGIKAVEYHEKYVDKLIPGRLLPWNPFGPDLEKWDLPAGVSERQIELFYWIYFALTGLHALHMIIGAGVLLVILYLGIKGRFSPEYHNPVEVTGLYWHFVDIVWIFLFPLLYLLGRHVGGH
ncbi:MAG TPA: cytochrome c oxidase subunit 3 family protein [Pyrinomonadaceae bacterium]|nr:cytochrome c oxidase subunit 3 family protein [Pyrinomonadaceae bacterium]